MHTFCYPQEHFLSVEAFADNIYKHYLFDVPRILDLCGVYGASNAQLVSKMVDNIFNNQILYRMDLRLSLGRIKKVSLLTCYLHINNFFLVCVSVASFGHYAQVW